MALNNIPDLSLATTCPINTINGRQRSNTSPTQPLSSFKTGIINDATLPCPPAPTIDQFYEYPPLMRQGDRHADPRNEFQTLTGTDGHPTNPLSSSISHYTRSLKREATSPVYLDQSTISLASSNNNSYFLSHGETSRLTRRVVQCNSDRVRSSDSDVTSISSQDENHNFNQKPECSDSKTLNIKNRKKSHGQRNKWTHEETQALVRGCNNFAIGQWKAIRDSEPELSKRSPGDLKDRFRTYFPDAYRKHYPNAKTHISSRVRSVDSNGNPLFGENAVRRERKQFSPEEDAALKRGYVKFGTAWSSIQKDPVLASRKATDLRDRFRNAFPQIYAAAGYKPRSRKASGSNVFDLLSDGNQQHGTFEAIDLSVHPPHPSRLPSLDFLKAHGADAFSHEFNKTLSNPQLPMGDDTFQLDDPQMLATRISPAIPTHFTTTPRPNLTTPRPNDTTPRPRKTLATTTRENLDASSIGTSKQAFHSLLPLPPKPQKSLHKTQSSMDLTQFSNLHLVDTSLNHMAMPHHMEADPHHSHHTCSNMYSPTPTDYLEYGVASTGHCRDNSFLQNFASKLPLRPGENLGESVGNGEVTGSSMMAQLAHDFKAASAMNDETDWLRELEVASQSFPNAFDLSGFTNGKVFESPDGGSRGSSLISPDPSKDASDDRVVYTGDGNQFHQSPPACHSFMSQQDIPQHQSQVHSMSMQAPQAQEFFLNGQFTQNTHNLIHELSNQENRMSMDNSHVHLYQLEQTGHLYPHHHAELMNNAHLNQITLCPPLLASNLNSPLPCSPTSSASASSAMRPSSSTSSLSAISSPANNNLDLLNM
ncbi:hypothetical protein PCASD_22596 [Puccinia coronata f. sp. avenae]|uniref:Myb-like domain-containing protein n=1 Tax=Puccinia coronata f. sp. avenae TaxID=200324 RepID=A0A2N5S453_9BASI|nr:hypothetical protein PCASD_22596 [Puccinia coronata f. sp. avenae]